MTVGELIKALSKFPDNYLVYAYEGEDIGVVVCDKNGKQVSMIHCLEENQ